MLPLRRGIATMAGKFRLALVQMMVSTDKQSNLDKAAKLVSEASQNGANIVALPECFNSPYGTSFFKEYSETIPGNTTSILSEIAKKNKVFLVGGSIPESSDGKLFNCSTVYNDQGELITKFRKMHLFDIDVPGKITFKESTTLSPGDNFCVFQTPFCKVGLGICYDIRFPEVAQIYANQGCDLIIYPGAFNMTTGPAHWELLVRSRAADNQVYSAVVSPARDETSSYVAWGHSTVAGPWGDVLGKLDEKEGILYTDIDLNRAAEVRQQIPTRNQKRHDVYVGSKQLS